MLTWAGDQNVDFGYSDGLASTIPAAVSLGLSGFGLTHFDIGGYTTTVARSSERVGIASVVSVSVEVTRSRELLLKSAESAVFTPIMRTHEGASFQTL